MQQLARRMAVTLFTSALLGSLACRTDTTAPAPALGPPYIAIVTLLDAPNGADVGGPYRYAVKGLTTTAPLDTIVTAAPTDTIILSVKPGTYDVALEGFPGKCTTRFGDAQTIVVPEGSNTSIARYTVICRPLLRLEVQTEGNVLDDAYVYRVSGPGGSRVGTVPALGSVLVEGLPIGEYDIELTNLAANCTSVGSVAPSRRVSITETGNAQASFRIGCSDVARQPEMLAVTAQRVDERTVGVLIRARDVDRDLDRYILDATDCAGRSVRRESEPSSQRGLRSDRTAFQDTVVVLTAFDLVEAEGIVSGPRCVAVRVADGGGNTTSFLEVPLQDGPTSRAPLATTFTARYEGTTAIATRVNAFDRQGDFLGVWAQLRLRDGVLGSVDGEPDIGFYNVAGFLGTTLPNVPLSGRVGFGDVLAVEVLLFDAEGNVALVRDTDFNQ